VTFGGRAGAQELEPRAYSDSPIGVSFFGVGYGYSTGSVITDPALPVTDVSAHISGVSAGFGHTFGVLGRQALAVIALPYAFGNAEGNVGEEHRRITRSGLADLRARFSVNLLGNPALTPEEFARRPHDKIIVGASLFLTAPTGQYDRTKLINLGTSRWAFRPEVGVSVPWKGFDFDVYAGVWFFTRNRTFYPGESTRTQDPLTSIQLHVSYTIKRGLWVAFDSTWYGGGAAHVNGGPPSQRLSNSRFGLTGSIPIAKNQAIKLAFSRGAIVRAGSNFTTVAAGWQILWF